MLIKGLAAITPKQRMDFKKERNAINSNINYWVKKEITQDTVIAIDALSRKLCNLYITANKTPKKSFKYWEIYEEELNKSIEEIISNPEEVEKEALMRDMFDKDELKYVRKLMSNSNIQFKQKEQILTQELNVTCGELDQLLEELGISTEATHFEKAKFNKIKQSKRYLITSAQTASPVNKTVFNNMKAYAKHINAEIAIVATRYRNPTSVWKETGDIWDECALPYLTAMRQDLHEDVCLLADLKIQATSPNPTGQIDSFEGQKSLIVGSPCVEFKSVATLEEQKQKFIMSTGSITEPSFTDTVAGGKAAEHHQYGFVIVEVDEDDVAHMRNVVCDVEGGFNDLIFRVENEEVFTEDTEYLVWGDSHFAQKDEKVTKAFRGLCYDLSVTKSVLHDVWDSESINVHNIKDPIVQQRLHSEGRNSLEGEIDQMIDELEWFEDNMNETIVVGSNHDDMLDRAMLNVDWRDIPHNAKKFVELLSIKLSGYAPNGLVPYMISNEFNNILSLGVDDSYVRYGTELALHGHKGPNGSRGNINAFAKLPIPSITGHNHCGAIKWGCYQAGISCGMKHGYNTGLSGWSYSGVTLNKRGTKQLIVFNKFTLNYTGLYENNNRIC